MSEQVGEPTIVDMMLGTIAVIQDFKQRVSKLQRDISDFSNSFIDLKDAKNIVAFSMYNNLVQAAGDFDLATLHLGFSEKNAFEIYEKLKKREETGGAK